MAKRRKPQKDRSIPWHDRLHEIIFEAGTPAGKAFDVVLLLLILISVIATSLETVERLGKNYKTLFLSIEWSITIIFLVEYLLRIVCVKRPWAYIRSFYGIVDLLSILPAFIGLNLHYQSTSRFAVVRSLRLLRVFRVFGLGWFVAEANSLSNAFWQSRAKIVVFLFAVLILVTLTGSLMFEIEGGTNPNLNSIPDGIYFAIVTMTTVGFGDISPVTGWGRLLSSLLILMGYSLIIVPTGLVSAEFVKAANNVSAEICSTCLAESHANDAIFCRVCGSKL